MKNYTFVYVLQSNRHMSAFVKFVLTVFGRLRAVRIKHAVIFMSLVILIWWLLPGCGNTEEERIPQTPISDEIERVDSQKTVQAED